MQNRKEFQIKGNTWGAIIFLVVAFVALFFIARMIFTILSYLAPVLLIATLIIDHKVFINYVKWLVDLTRRNVLVGVGAIVLSVIGFPIVSAFLLIRALANRRLRDVEKQERIHREGELVEYEELEPEKPGRVELPQEPKEDDLV
jgi:hypothetical protein